MNGNIPYSIARIRAGTDFWGYYHDYDYTSATIGYPFSDRLQGNVSWYQYKDNLNLRRLEEPLRPMKSFYRFILIMSWPTAGISHGYDSFSMEDRLLPAEYWCAKIRGGFELGEPWIAIATPSRPVMPTRRITLAERAGRRGIITFS